MTRDLLVVLPTRGRPESVRRFLRSYEKTAAPGSDLVVVTDEDDQESTDAAFDHSVSLVRFVKVLPRLPLARKINDIVVPETANYKAAMFLGDDCVFRTHGWNARVLEALDKLGGEGVIGTNDLVRHGELFNHAAISSGIISALGWFANKAVCHYGMDDTWTELGRGAGCLAYLEDVVIEHLHPVYGKSAPDQTYTETYQAYWDRDMAALGTWRMRDARADLEKVRGVVRGPGR